MLTPLCASIFWCFWDGSPPQALVSYHFPFEIVYEILLSLWLVLEVRLPSRSPLPCCHWFIRCWKRKDQSSLLMNNWGLSCWDKLLCKIIVLFDHDIRCTYFKHLPFCSLCIKLPSSIVTNIRAPLKRRSIPAPPAGIENISRTKSDRIGNFRDAVSRTLGKNFPRMMQPQKGERNAN